jgi:capsular polysaccharide export protein
MDRVYTVTSQMGFEALLLGKPVTCFGVPFYSGWGVTDDRTVQPRRTRKRSVEEIFIAAYMNYCRYLDPATACQGTIFDVIEHLGRQRRMASQNSGRLFFFGFSRWKRHHIRSFFQGYSSEIIFCRRMDQAMKQGLDQSSRIVVWGHNDPEGLSEFASLSGNEIWRIEDGFIRSVGLGSDFVPPMSLVLDKRGIYYDATRESDLEHILNTQIFSPELLDRAERLRSRIVEGNITKYNTEQIKRPEISIPSGKKVIFVPGQVEDDASIKFGTRDIKTNAQLLQEARRAGPDAFIIYKPHPDVVARNRKGAVSFSGLKGICDHIETKASVISCIGVADEVHTMTSLTGFDALLRAKKVVTYGSPFYAGWGLTEDRHEVPRRRRRLQLSELIAGTLIAYPRYFDWGGKNFVECETIISKIVALRGQLEAEGRISNLQPGYLERRIRKTILLLKGLAGK